MAKEFPFPPRLMSIAQAVAHSNISRSVLYADMKAGNIKFVKIGASTRIEFDELNRYIDAKIGAAA